MMQIYNILLDKANMNTHPYKATLTLVTSKSLPLGEHTGLPPAVVQRGFQPVRPPAKELCVTLT